MIGYYCMYRGWQENPIFDNEPYTQREAWEWLIANACYQQTKARISGKMLKLERGQLCFSVRFMAERWQWSKSKVARFLERLKIGTMIDTNDGTHRQIITICNYEKYQNRNESLGTTLGTDRGTTVGQLWDKEEEGKERYDVNARARDPTAFQKIYEAGSAVFPSLATASTAPIQQWIAAGCDADLDAVPEIQRLAKAGKSVKAWAYFTDPIMNAKATRETPLPQGKANGNYSTSQPRKSKIERAAEAIQRGYAAIEQRGAKPA